MRGSPALIARVRESVRTRLAAGLGSGLAALPDQLYAQGTGSRSLAEHRILGEAVGHVRACKAQIAETFEREFASLFENKARPRQSVSSAEMSLSQATLVDHAVIEQHIALGHLVRKTRDELDGMELYAIETRVGELVAGARLEGEANPVGPETAFEALRRACDVVPADGAVRMALMNALQPHIGLALGELYRELNELLAQEGVSRKIRHAVEKSTLAKAGGGGGAPAVESQKLTLSQALSLRDLLPTSTSRPMDLASIMRAYLQGPPETRQYGARMLADPDGSLFAEAMTTPVDAGLLTQLSALQSAAAPGTDLATGAGDLLAILQHLGHMQHHPLDKLTGELVAVVFDHLLHSRDLPEAVKAEIARLQVVAFKAALLDRSFFARREHPLRELLTAITDAATDPQTDSAPDGRFVAGLRAIVDDVLARFSDDVAIFADARARLATLVTELRQESEREVEKLAVEVAGEERVAEARAHAAVEIGRRTSADTPEFVRRFLADTWMRAITDATAPGDAGEDGWDARLKLVDDLLWSLAPKQATDVPRLTAMLPQLVAGLSRGMQAVATPEATQRTFLDELMHAHAALLQAAGARRPVAADEAPVPPAAPATVAPEPVAAPEAADDKPPDVEQGMLIEFTDVEPPVRARLMWISPKRTVYVFIIHGVKTRRMSPRELAEALRAGTARVVKEGEAIVERALEAVVGGGVET
jgi:hypothetical protein